MIGAELLVKSLLSYNVKYIFGYPGDETAIFKALINKKITFITARHEQGAAFMADAYARMSGNIGVCYSTLGPGATNLVTGIANAYMDRSPVIAISDQVETSEVHRGAHQYIDLKKIFEPITKMSLNVEDTETIPQLMDFAVDTALQERPGPVHLTIPKDVLRRDVYLFSTRKKLTTRPAKCQTKKQNKTLSKKVADDLKNSMNPVLIIGNLAIRLNISSEIQDLVEHFKIPTFTTYMGKGSFPESHPLSLGVLSRHAKDEMGEIFYNADLILLIGFDYAEGIKPSFWTMGKQKTVISLDESIHTEGIFYKPDITITQGVKETLLEIKKNASKNLNEKSWLDVPKIRKEIRSKMRSGAINQQGKVTPESVMEVISKLGVDLLVTSDVGLNKYAVGLCLQVENPRSVMFSNGLSSMGFSLPAAIGAKIACPQKTVISISGDGGFLMNMQELETCKRTETQIIVIVLRDNSLGLIKRMQKYEFKSCLGVDIGNPDFVLLAKSFGIKSSKVKSKTDLNTKLRRAISSKEPYLIEVPISYESWLE